MWSLSTGGCRYTVLFAVLIITVWAQEGKPQDFWQVTTQPERHTVMLQQGGDCPSQLTGTLSPRIALFGQALQVQLVTQWTMQPEAASVSCQQHRTTAEREGAAMVRALIVAGPGYSIRRSGASGTFALPPRQTELSGWSLRVDIQYFQTSLTVSFALGTLVAPPWGHLAVQVIDATGQAVNVPVLLFDGANRLLQSTSATVLANTPWLLSPGTYTVAIAEKHRQAVQVHAGQKHSLQLGHNMLALPLLGPDQQQPWQPFDLIAPLVPHPWGGSVYLGKSTEMLQREELVGKSLPLAADQQAGQQLVEKALHIATQILESPQKTWETSLLAVQTLAELGETDVIPRLQRILTQPEDGWIKVHMQAARGLARLLSLSETLALFRKIFQEGGNKAIWAAATVAAEDHLLDPQELLLAVRPLLQDTSARRHIIGLLAALELPLPNLWQLAQELGSYEPPYPPDDQAVLFALARHGEPRALGLLRELLHEPSAGDLAREFLIRLVEPPTRLMTDGLMIKRNVSQEEWRRTNAVLRTLLLLGWRQGAAVIDPLRRIVRTTGELRVLRAVVPLLTEQYDVTGVSRLATVKASHQEVANEMALLLAEAGVGSHLPLIERWLQATLAQLEQEASKDKQDDLFVILRRHTEVVGRTMAAPHQADARRAYALLAGYLEHPNPALRLLAIRGVLFGLQAQHRKWHERGPVQADLFYHYTWGKERLSVFAPLFFALAPRLSLAAGRLRADLNRVMHADCYEDGGMIPFTCIDIKEKPTWDGPQWPITMVTLLAPDGQRHPLPVQTQEGGKLFSELQRKPSEVPGTWEGWTLEVTVSYLEHGKRTYRFDLPQLFR